MTDIVGKLWGFCHTLRHDGIDYGDYIEQLTYLLFLKMIEEKGAEIPSDYSWVVLREKSGTDLTEHYMDTLRALGKEKNMLGDIYSGAISRFSNPVNLKRLVNLIDEIECARNLGHILMRALSPSNSFLTVLTSRSLFLTIPVRAI